jgi:DNA-binding NarL/FixJ family response regulator
VGVHGRELERARICRLLAEAADAGGGALLVRGEAGIGKTTLLGTVQGSGRVLRVQGVEDEAAFPLAALERLLLPLTGDVPGASDPAGAGRELLEVLRAHGPLVCVVDDAQWLDRESAAALLFAARRLHGSGLVLLLAAEPGFEAPGLPIMELMGLSVEAAAALLDEHGLADQPGVRDRLVREARGNPLALLEFAASLTREQRLGQAQPPFVPAATPPVLARFWHRLAHLSPGALALLMLAAAEETGDVTAVMAAGAELGVNEEHLGEVQGFLRVGGLRLAVEHPLLRSAAYHLMPLAGRLRAHRLLAEASTDPVGRLRHLDAATLSANERLAAELEDVARRSAPAVAACIYDHAVRRSEDPAQRLRRFRAAGQALLLSGDYRRALPRLAEPGSAGEALLAGADRTALDLAQAQVTELRSGRMVGSLPAALDLLARAQLAGGRIAAADDTLVEALELAREATVRDRLRDVQSVLAAMRGRPHGAPGLLYLGLARYTEALEALDAAWRTPRRHDWPTLAADLVEAAVGAGQPARAAEPLDDLTRWAEAVDTPWALAVLLRCRAMLAHERSLELFAEAVRLHEEGGRPFERARTELLYGQQLRRARGRAKARQPLRSAADLFDRMGAVPWAERATAELRAAGGLPGDNEGDPLTRLTPQERQIVQLAAHGVSNRDIATRLFLSPRTVEYHLYKAYPKLGVGSRGELTGKV